MQGLTVKRQVCTGWPLGREIFLNFGYIYRRIPLHVAAAALISDPFQNFLMLKIEGALTFLNC